jgi:hypothetical protein
MHPGLMDFLSAAPEMVPLFPASKVDLLYREPKFLTTAAYFSRFGPDPATSGLSIWEYADPNGQTLQGHLNQLATMIPRSLNRGARCDAHGAMTSQFPSCPHCGLDLDPDALGNPRPVDRNLLVQVGDHMYVREWLDVQMQARGGCRSGCEADTDHSFCQSCGGFACLAQSRCMRCLPSSSADTAAVTTASADDGSAPSA